MASLDSLHRSVQNALPKVGTPVFVRYLLFSQDKQDSVLVRLSAMLEKVQGWMKQPFDRFFTVGSVASGQVTLTCEFKTGATALLSWSNSAGRGLGVDVMVLGNHGAIYHDSGQAVLWDDAPTLPLQTVP